MNELPASTTIGLLGFGEVGRRLADDLATVPGVSLRAWDILFTAADSAPSAAVRSRPGVKPAASARALAEDCDLIISAVTAGQAAAAAASVAAGIRPRTLLLDVNSVSPRTRQRSAAVFAGHGGLFIEAAVMSPIEPRGIASPILLGGPHAADFARLASGLGFTGVSVCSADLGAASAAKLCRSIVIKGLEALLAECLLAARQYGVGPAVLASLEDLFEKPASLAAYMIRRSIEHGGRRAEEMREAAAMVSDAGVDPWMSRACAERQAWATGFGTALMHDELDRMLEAIRSAGKC